jgi:2-keto-4-pentenoate hydratase/2-oxohepta-3-ene-1,7-dioic acid hydratase in catechol pathway
MKLATFLTDAGPKLGVLGEGGVIPLASGLADLDMISLIGGWNEHRRSSERTLHSGRAAIPLEAVTLVAPIARPGKILCIGLNYADHVRESELEWPVQQLWFSKAGTTVHPPYAPVEIPKASDKVDYEAEMVVVIGKTGRHISRASAPDYVFGYCVGNDVSVRDWQLATPQWMLGKSFDTHAPFGPWITTSDEVGDPHLLDIRCIVNGETRQQSNTRHLIFNVYDQIAHLSEAMTLEQGDIIFTGTPGGVGLARKPPCLLKAGDVVRCEIDRLGWIENSFEDER